MRELKDPSYPYTNRKTSFLKGFLGGHIGLRKYYEPRGYSKYTIFRGYTIPFHNNFTYIVLYDKPKGQGGKCLLEDNMCLPTYFYK